ncbi:hypothetical protein I4641_20120 [Waterburya agarophytonicola K14]|uniref:Uncharacterized protein n=1 Tax=Waterburya agarophytonicola KI4 TaxID=2874699 RepID=A0A964BUA5_9CYAN|nr:hypothetical protein [Waterburya agarophytonicola]MCC0179274.1 hypothetical protein [Waterburya agarophytonicola KI4]
MKILVTTILTTMNEKDNSLDFFLSLGIGFSTLISGVEDEVGVEFDF